MEAARVTRSVKLQKIVMGVIEEYFTVLNMVYSFLVFHENAKIVQN